MCVELASSTIYLHTSLGQIMTRQMKQKRIHHGHVQKSTPLVEVATIHAVFDCCLMHSLKDERLKKIFVHEMCLYKILSYFVT